MDVRTVLIICVLCGTSWSQTIRTVSTSLGTIRGSESDYSGTAGKLVYQFLGVPFAAPPTGTNRFRPPQPVQPWGSMDAFTYPAACHQNPTTFADLQVNQQTSNDVLLIGLITASEDCLYLNIYAPAYPTGDNRTLPVMVFIHGGDYISGTGSFYKGAIMAGDHDVVLVNINYRLGAFGFLSNGNDDISGNYGLLDQRMALQWVKQHIAAFGGDPNSITLFGEGSGGSSVHLHTLAGESNLFHNAIIQSAQYDDGAITQQQCNDQYAEFVSYFGYDPVANVSMPLRTVLTADQILEASYVLNYWRPCVHNASYLPSEVMKRSNVTTDFNILCGSNSAASLYQAMDTTGDSWLSRTTQNILEQTFAQLYGNITNQTVNRMSENYFQFYSPYGSEDVTMIDFDREHFAVIAMSDQLYVTWTQEISKQMGAKCSGCSVYQYMFTKVSPTATVRSVQGAAVTEELPYLFGYDIAEASTLSDTMMTYWTNFAKTGNPNVFGSLVATWPPYEANTTSESCRNVLEITSDVVTMGMTSQKKGVSRSWDFWNSYYDVLGFSCFINPSDTDVTIEECEPTVYDVIGMAVTNEEAAIMLIAFICLTGIFLVSSLIATLCYCKTKKKLKKEKKKNKKEGHDNPTSCEYKL